MKKIILIAICLTFTQLAYAGKVKDLVIDADYEIERVISENADLKLLSISNYTFVNSAEGINLQALVETQNVKTLDFLTFSCIVHFESDGTDLEATDTECF